MLDSKSWPMRMISSFIRRISFCCSGLSSRPLRRKSRRISARMLALALEGLGLGGVGADDAGEIGVEVEPREERVGLGLAELGGLAHRGVGVGDGGELVELGGAVDLEDDVVEAAEHRVVGERRGRGALQRFDPLHERLRGLEVVVAEPLGAVDRHAHAHRIEVGAGADLGGEVRRRGRGAAEGVAASGGVGAGGVAGSGAGPQPASARTESRAARERRGRRMAGSYHGWRGEGAARSSRAKAGRARRCPKSNGAPLRGGARRASSFDKLFMSPRRSESGRTQGLRWSSPGSDGGATAPRARRGSRRCSTSRCW